jgi:hypothetical protein
MRFKVLLIAGALIAALVVAAPGDLGSHVALGLLGLAALDSLTAALTGGSFVLATTGATFTNLTAGLKRRFDDNFKGVVAWSKGAAAAMLRKKAWDGEFAIYNMRVGNSPARSATYSVAKAKSEDATYGFTKVKQAQVAWAKDYGRATIEGLLMKSASSKSGTSYDKFVAQLDGIYDATMHSLSTKVYRDGYGCIGNISSGTNVATTTLTLAVPEDIILYEQGMDLQFSLTNNANTLRNAGASLTVTALGTVANGNLTMSAAINTVTGTIAGDFIFAKGDRQDSATPTRLAVPGFDAWLPTAAPAGGENFYNLGDRNNDGRLLGTVIDCTTGTYSGASEVEALIAAAIESTRVGGKPRTCFMNPTRYGNLVIDGQSRVRPTEARGPYGIGFSGVTVSTNFGDINVFPDPYCPRKRSYVVNMDSWTVYSVGTATMPDFIMDDGNKILRQTDDDGVECRVGYYGAQGTNAPVQNVVIKHES